LSLPRDALEGLALAYDLDAAPASWTDAAALDATAARHVAMLGRSDVLAGLADYDAAEANLRLQLAQQYPNIVFGPSYKYDEGNHRYGFNLALDLPLLSRNEGGIEEAAAARGQAAARFDALQTRVLVEVDGATAALDGALGERSRAEEMIRGSDQAAAFAARSLAAGASDRATYLAAEVAREEVGLLAVDADEHWKLAIARLELAARPVGPVDSTLTASAQR
jgi:outer membrane protein TolC